MHPSPAKIVVVSIPAAQFRNASAKARADRKVHRADTIVVAAQADHALPVVIDPNIHGLEGMIYEPDK